MLRIASVQMNINKDKDRNLSKILHYLKKAYKKKASMVCFPEHCIMPDENNLKPIGPFLDAIGKDCKKFSIWCIVGSYAKEFGKIFNVIYLIDGHGKIRAKYKKTHLWRSERKLVSSGNRNKVIDTEFGKIGIINCWDFAFPEFIKKLSKKGAKIIFCPSYLVDYKGYLDMLKSVPLVRAFENLCYFVLASAANKDTARISYICSPSKVLSKIENKEGIILADVNLKSIRKLRSYFGL